MKIVHTPPPNYEEVKKHFPTADFDKGTLFTYGDTCYCKSITPDLVVHEETHTRQQANPEEWWSRYFVDVEFRLEQELEAYRNQWRFIKKNVKDRNQQERYLSSFAKDLSSPLYGSIVTYSEARSLIKTI